MIELFCENCQEVKVHHITAKTEGFGHYMCEECNEETIRED